MTCECISCPECNGTGMVWWSFSGKYLGNRRCDDLDEMESCDRCGGEEVDIVCDECLDKYQDD